MRRSDQREAAEEEKDQRTVSCQLALIDMVLLSLYLRMQIGICESCPEFSICLFQVFRDHLGFSQNRHEVGVAEPSRHHVYMHVLFEPCSRSPAHIDTHVNTFGIEFLSHYGRAYLDESDHIEKLFVRQR